MDGTAVPQSRFADFNAWSSCIPLWCVYYNRMSVWISQIEFKIVYEKFQPNKKVFQLRCRRPLTHGVTAIYRSKATCIELTFDSSRFSAVDTEASLIGWKIKNLEIRVPFVSTLHASDTDGLYPLWNESCSSPKTFLVDDWFHSICKCRSCQ